MAHKKQMKAAKKLREGAKKRGQEIKRTSARKNVDAFTKADPKNKPHQERKARLEEFKRGNVKKRSKK